MAEHKQEWDDQLTPVVDANAGHEDGSGCWKYDPRGADVDADTARDLERQAGRYRSELGMMKVTMRDSVMDLWHDVRTVPPSMDYHDGWNAALLAVKTIMDTVSANSKE